MSSALTYSMKIIEKSMLKDGSYIVLRENGSDELVTGMIPAWQLKGQAPTDRMEHTWGHYFNLNDEGAEKEARADYLQRIGRGY